MNLSDLCTPAQIYFVISLITLVLAVIKKFNISSILYKVVFMFAWTWFLNFLCSKGYKSVSWFLVLLPFVIMALGIIMVVGSASKVNQQQQQRRQQ